MALKDNEFIISARVGYSNHKQFAVSDDGQLRLALYMTEDEASKVRAAGAGDRLKEVQITTENGVPETLYKVNARTNYAPTVKDETGADCLLTNGDLVTIKLNTYEYYYMGSTGISLGIVAARVHSHGEAIMVGNSGMEGL